jgi:hypothetical protein
MTTKRTKKPPPIAFTWHRALRRWPHQWENPGKQAVVAVGMVVADYADRERTSFPAIETIMIEVGATRRTVRAALRHLVTTGWLDLTAKAVPYHRPAVYRLTIPDGAAEHPLADASDGSDRGAVEHPYGGARRGAVEQPYNGAHRGARMGARMGALEHPVVLASSLEEEEDEDGVAPSADAPVAPPKSETADVSPITRDITAAMGMSIGSTRLRTALGDAKARTGFSDAVLAAYCVELLRRQGERVQNPSAFLAADVAQLDDSTAKSPGMELAGVMADLATLDEDWRQLQDEETSDPGASPWGCFEDQLFRAELIKEDNESPPWWKVGEDDIAAFARQARMVLMLFEIRQRRPTPSTPVVSAPVDHQPEGES